MNLEEQLKVKEEQLTKVGEEINQLQRTIAQNRETVNQKTSEAFRLDGAVSVLKELQENKAK